MIPPVLHRCVPEHTAPQTEEWWEQFGKLHPGWGLRTWRDPLDPAEWETGDLFGRCTSGAQLAGLVRLEALYRHGGIYVDSDVEPYQPLHPLLSLSGFAAWEDANCVPDAVLGFTAGHPALREMLDLARERICSERTDWRTGSGAWATGPGVTTTVLPGRPDVLLLPPGSFFQVHYLQKDKLAEPHLPWEFARHHWRGSWLPESQRDS